MTGWLRVVSVNVSSASTVPGLCRHARWNAVCIMAGSLRCNPRPTTTNTTRWLNVTQHLKAFGRSWEKKESLCLQSADVAACTFTLPAYFIFYLNRIKFSVESLVDQRFFCLCFVFSSSVLLITWFFSFSPWTTFVQSCCLPICYVNEREINLSVHILLFSAGLT